jgi:glycosyltransferase involved in cell wall biosynthesis
MNNNPKLSILIATYNQPNYILKAVESCLSQSYCNLEIIVGDDSENNDTHRLLENYIVSGQIVYFRNQNNIGRVANYRKLLYEYASGDWVVVLDGDDYYIENDYFTDVIYRAIENPHVVMISAGHFKLYEASGIKERDTLTMLNRVIPGKQFLTDFMKMPQHSTNVYRRELACNLDFYRHSSNASDAESLYRLALNGDVFLSNLIPVVWRIHGENTTFNRNLVTQIKELSFIDEIYKYSIAFITKRQAKLWRDKYYISMYHHLNSIAYANNDLFIVGYLSLKAFRYWRWYSILNVYIFCKRKFRISAKGDGVTL